MGKNPFPGGDRMQPSRIRPGAVKKQMKTSGMTEQNLLAVGQPEGSTAYPGCFLYGKWKWQKNKILIKNSHIKRYLSICTSLHTNRGKLKNTRKKTNQKRISAIYKERERIARDPEGCATGGNPSWLNGKK